MPEQAALIKKAAEQIARAKEFIHLAKRSFGAASPRKRNKSPKLR